MKARFIVNLIMMTAFGATLVCCSNASLYQKAAAPAAAEINFCTTPTTAIVSKLKYLFVTDVSGSNQNNFVIAGPGATPAQDTSCGTPPCGTDPTGVRRYSGLINFLNTNAAQNYTNVYYASLFFSTSPTVPFGGTFNGAGPVEDTANSSIWYTNFGAGPTPNPASYMAQQYTNIWCPASSGQTYPNCTQPQDPGGWTDYVDTLGSTVGIYEYITQDLKYEQKLTELGLQPQTTSAYVIFWTSDGFPYTAQGPQASGAILQDVQDIMNLKSSQEYGQLISSISLNTAFYFTTDTASYEYSQAETLMSEMANIGEGAFFLVSAGQDIPYTQFSIPTQNPQFVLRDLWVNDASSIWWNGKRMLDSDNDGIPDQIETQWGSNPKAYDSDGNGIGDGVEYSLWNTPCGNIPVANLGQAGQTCTNAGANKSFYGTCGAPPYNDTDQDNLNDCEENLLGSNPTNFDTNGDFVPDQFEWLYNVAYNFGTNSLNSDPTNDGVTNYQKLKDLFPVNVPMPQLNGITPMSYQLTQTSTNASQTCYQAQVTNVPVMSNADVLRVYIMETYGTGGSNVNHMRVLNGVKTMNGTNTLILNDTDFTP
jgi:hypothetical protein